MTADTLSAEEIEELEWLLAKATPGPISAKYYVGGGYRLERPDGNDLNLEFRDTFFEYDAKLIAKTWERLPALLRLARLATPELVELGEAAVRVAAADQKQAEWGDTVAVHLAENELMQAARTYALSLKEREG